MDTVNKSQRRAIDQLKLFLRQRVERNNDGVKNDRCLQALTVFEVESTSYSTAWVKAEITYPNAEGTMLSLIGREHFFVEVGERGKLTARMFPKSWDQFKGRRVFCLINVARDR